MISPQAMIFSSSSSLISYLFYGLAIMCLTSATVSASYGGNETDYLALLSFKSKITHDPYQVLSTWNHSFHFCEWSGITCGKRHKRVIALRLGSQGLEGSLSPHVGNLSFLRELFLRNNSFQGNIPHELGRLSRLYHLYLDANKFNGIIPTNLSRCSNLEDLWLNENMLAGSIPKEMSFISKLSRLVISVNNLTGGIPPFLGNITSMETFSAAENPLGGRIPDTLGLWKSLMGFGCGGCNLHGSIPHSIFNLSLLNVISLSANLIGEGGFHSVYKGILDSDDDRFVAVKVLHLQYRGALKSFLAECEAWRNIRHRNVLKIVTSCSSTDFQGKDFKAIVYEFMPNGSVHDWLHSSENTSKLNLLQRINILVDIATALDYLHNHCQTTIVHGDLKPSNILLDDDMVAHVGDFGLARLLGTDLYQHSSTGVRGTIGYAPPEYGIGSEMQCSGDVYSFGILLLEVMTGKKPTNDMFIEGLSIHKFASMALPDRVLDVIDDDAIVLQSTEANAKKVEECLVAIIKIGVSCSVDSPPQRMNIDIVVNELQCILDVLQNI